MHLRCLGPESCVFTSRASLGLTSGSSPVWWLLDSRYSSPSWVPLGAHWLSLEDCSHCWLQRACLLTWQEITSLLTRKKKTRRNERRRNKEGKASFCQLQSGTNAKRFYQQLNNDKGICHLPLLLQLMTFNPLRREFRVEWGTLLQVIRWDRSLVRYLQEPISWSRSLHHLISKKALNLFMVTSAPHD